MSDPALDHLDLEGYLAESLPPETMARVEKALRDSAELRERLEVVRGTLPEQSLHSLGAIWRRGRLTCPSREQLGSYLLDVLDPDFAGYVGFHIETVECPFCRANVDDLRKKAEVDTGQAPSERRRQIFHSSRHLLPGDLE